MLQKVETSISFNQGIDTKTDPKQVITGKLLTLQNMIFKTAQSLSLRNGYQALATSIMGGGSISAGVSLAAYANSLTLSDGQALYSYSEDAGTWDPKGFKETLSITSSTVTGSATNVVLQDSAVHSSGAAIFTWVDSQAGTVGYSIVDTTTQQPILGSGTTFTGTSCKPTVLGANFVLFIQNGSNIQTVTIPVATPSSPGVATNLVSITSGSAPHDIVTVSSTVYLFYVNGSGVPVVSSYNSSLTLVNTVTLTSESAQVLTVLYDSNSSLIWVFYYNGTAIRCAIYNTNLTVFRAAFTSVTVASVINLTAVTVSSTATLFFELQGSSTDTQNIKVYTVTSGGTSTSLSALRSVGLASKAFVPAGGTPHVITVHDSSLQATYFVTRATGVNNYSTCSVAGKIAALNAGGLVTGSSLPFVYTLSGSSLVFPYLLRANTSIIAGSVTYSKTLNVALLNFTSQPGKVQLANNLHLSGGLLSSYDGSSIVEHGFNLWPETTTPTTYTTMGGIAPGTYGYVAIYEWLDSLGQTHRSAASTPNPYAVGTMTQKIGGDSSSSTIAVDDSSLLVPGMTITGANLAANTVVSGIINKTSITVSPNPTGTAFISYATFSTTTGVSVAIPFNPSGYSNFSAVTTPATLYVTGNPTQGSNSLFINASLGVVKGLAVSDNLGFIPGGTTISSVTPQNNGSLITLSNSATGTSGAETIALNYAFTATPSGSTNTTLSGITPVQATDFQIGQFIYPSTGGTTTVISKTATTITISGVFATSTYTAGFPLGCFLHVGQTVTGTNIQANTHIKSLSLTTGTLDLPATSGAGTTLSTTETLATAVSVPTLRITEKGRQSIPVTIHLYRTISGGSVYFKVGSGLNDTTVDTINVYDGLSDRALTGNEQLYTTGGEVENVSPPASLLMCTYKNRVILVPSEETSSWWYSKQVIPGSPVEFSDLLVQNIDQDGGGITACASMDDKLILFKKTLPYYVVGDGPAPSGANNDFSYPQKITSDVGCSNQASLVLIPQGLMFQSDKGIYLLDRSLGVTYIGKEVEAFNGFTVTSAQLTPDTTQARFTLSNGTALVYDYLFGQWSVFTNMSAIDGAIYGNSYTYLQSNGLVQKETLGQYSDNGTGITPSLTTSWLSFAGLQGFQRVWRFLLLGTYYSPHQLTVTAAYDFDPTIKQTDTITVGSSVVPYQYRLHLARQKCESVQLTISASPTGTGKELSLSSLGFEVGKKQGLNKVAASQSYG